MPTAGDFWSGPDLWVRTTDPATDPIGALPYGANVPHQNAVFAVDHWVRARVKNVGTRPSSNFYAVKNVPLSTFSETMI